MKQIFKLDIASIVFLILVCIALGVTIAVGIWIVS